MLTDRRRDSSVSERNLSPLNIGLDFSASSSADDLISPISLKIAFRSSFVCKGIFSAISLIIIVNKSSYLIGRIKDFAFNQCISNFAVGAEHRH